MSMDDVAALALALPEVVEGTSYGNRAWSVGGRAFVWERPFSKADLKRFGDIPPPAGTIVAVRVADLHEKEAALSLDRRGVFTIPHFDGYAALLLQLDTISKRYLREAVLDGWLACAPAVLAKAHLAARR